MATETVNITGTIANDAVTNAKLANMAQGSIKGRAAGGGTGDPQDLTPDQASTVLDAATDPFVRTSNLPSGGGDVVGPASSTNNNLPQWDGTTGKLLKDGLGASTGGNDAADAGKVLLFGADGSLTASTSLGGGSAVVAETGALSTAAVDGFSTNGGEGGKFQSVGGDGVSGTSNTGVALRGTSDTGPGLHVNINDAGNTTDLALFHRDDNLGLEVRNDGGLAWTSATGAATTRTGLGLGGLAVLVAAPAGTLTGATLAAGVTASSLTSVGTIATGVWNGTDIAVADGGTGSSTAAGALTNLGAEAAANTQRVVLSADFTTSSATFVDVTGFAVTIPAGETWFIQIDGAYQSTNAATGVGVSLTRTGSPTRCNFERRIYTTNTTNVVHGSVGNVDDAGPINTTVDTINADRHWIMTGVVKAAGSNCVIQVRAGRGGSANNISIMAGAIIIAHKIA